MERKISLGTPRMTPQAFSAKWADARLKERAGSQEHFIDVCALFGKRPFGFVIAHPYSGPLHLVVEPPPPRASKPHLSVDYVAFHAAFWI